MCGGKYRFKKWFVEIQGERLINRTIRLLRENGVEDIYTTGITVEGVKHLEHDNNEFIANSGIGYWVDAFYPTNRPTIYLFGDVYYSENAIRSILSVNNGSVLFFGSKDIHHDGYFKPWEEPFAFKVEDQHGFRIAIEKVKIYKDQKLFNREPIAWELYRVYNGYDLNKHVIGKGYFAIDDLTTDIDTEEDARKLNAYLENRMKILVAVPTYETIYPDTFKSIYELDKGGNDVTFDYVSGYGVAQARNRIAEETLKGGYDYVLMVDNDGVIPKDALINLLDTEKSYKLGHCMVTGYTLTRPTNAANNTGQTNVFKFGGKDYTKNDAYKADEIKKLRSEGTVKVQIRGCGLACTLIHRTIFENMSFPYFKWVQYEGHGQLSEDLYFCEQFRGISTPIYMDTRVSCGHMMRHIDYI